MPDNVNPNLLMLLGFGLALVFAILGFIALLAQTTYLDRETLKSVEIELPLWGKLKLKMKTNYPALVFVLFGFGLAVYNLRSAAAFLQRPNVLWTVTGSFADPGITDWRARGKLILIPRDPPDPILDENGRFTITMLIEKSKSFEQVINTIMFTYPDREDATIHPMQEYEAYRDGRNSKLTNAGERSREYGVIRLKQLDAGRPEP